MKDMKRFFALLLVLSIAFTIIPAQSFAQNEINIGSRISDTQLSEAQVSQCPMANQFSSLGAEPVGSILINSPSASLYDTRVSYEIVNGGKAGMTEADTQFAMIRFTLINSGEEPVSFGYNAVSGSADINLHLAGTLSGTVSLSQTEPQKDIIIEIAPFADNPGNYNLLNSPNALWTGEHYFYLYCDDIKNALFDGNRESLTLPVPVESGFNYAAAYENAVNTSLINLNEVTGGTNGVYPVPESFELRLSAEISGDVRKMLDAGVFTDIHLPQGYFTNESGTAQIVSYQIKAINDRTSLELLPVFQNINLAETGQTSFYTEEFTQDIPVGDVNLGPLWESNGIFNKLDLVFDYSMLTSPGAISTCFLNETGEYLQQQLSFSDQALPAVTSVSTGVLQAFYGDEVPVIIGFSEPVHTDGITFKVGGQTLSPLERAGTISQSVSFLYRIGDEALNAESFTINISDINGAVDLSGKAQEVSGSGSTSVNISFDPRRSFDYCAEPSVNLDQGTGRNTAATVFIPLKQDTELSNWLISRVSEGNTSTAVKARAITTEGTMDIPLTLQTEDIRVTGLTGSFTVPENNTGEDVYYALEIYLDIGSGYKPVDSLLTIYAVQPLILVDDENDITLDLISLREQYGVHRMRPGLTGWAQVNGRDELPIPVKVEYDRYYVDNWSFWLDIKILFLTALSVVRHKGVVEGRQEEGRKVEQEA